MHRALKILEIVELICEEVGERDALEFEPLHGMAPRDLSVLARTSKKVFLNPALDVLWRHQKTIVNLLKTMPDDIWDISTRVCSDEGMEDDQRTELDIILRRAILYADWDRPRCYMFRVKHLSLENQFFESSDFFETLSMSLPEDCIFPNLAKLRWVLEPSHILHHVRWFLSPRLTDLTLNGLETVSHVSILSILPTKCPFLTKVDICAFSTARDSVRVPVSTFMRRLTRLESVLAPALDQPALDHLSQLPDLKDLTLDYPHVGSTQPTKQCTFPPHSFPALSRLAFRSTPTECITAFVVQHPCWRLVNLSILIDWPSQPTEAISRQLYFAVAKHISPSSLQKLACDAYNNYPPLPATPDEIQLYAVHSDTIRPLFSFSELTSVTLNHPAGFDLDDIAVHDLARSWPHLTYLSLQANDYRHIDPRVTLEGIYQLAKHCSDLRALEMTFDATVAPKSKIDGKKRASQRSLRNLNVALSPIRKPSRVAKWLTAIFSELTSIRTLHQDLMDCGEYEDDEGAEPDILSSHEGWKRVEGLLDN